MTALEKRMNSLKRTIRKRRNLISDNSNQENLKKDNYENKIRKRNILEMENLKKANSEIGPF